MINKDDLTRAQLSTCLLSLDVSMAVKAGRSSSSSSSLMGWDGLGWVWLGWAGLGYAGLSWAWLRWAELGLVTGRVLR